MSGLVVAVVLCAALLHAGWNALVKAGKDSFLTSVLVVAGAGLLSAAALPFLARPASASWPYLLASTGVHFAYFGLMAEAYRVGDMSHAYPLMRGSAPLLVALASAPLLGERLAPGQYAAVACICGGILAMSFAGRGGGAGHGRSTVFALANAAVIALYTLIDGVGARLSGAPAAYTMVMFMLTAAGLLAWTLWRRSAELRNYAAVHWSVAALGGAGTLASYAMVLWAMTVAPVAAVAALRETAILFAAAIAVLFLGETIAPRRYAAIAVIAAGAALMRYS